MEGIKKYKILQLNIKDYSDQPNIKESNYIINKKGALIGTDPENGKNISEIKNFQERTKIKIS